MLPALSIDMVLPGLSMIQAEFHAPQTEAASAIAIFIAGFSSAPIVVGPLADRTDGLGIEAHEVGERADCNSPPIAQPVEPRGLVGQ